MLDILNGRNSVGRSLGQHIECCRFDYYPGLKLLSLPGVNYLFPVF